MSAQLAQALGSIGVGTFIAVGRLKAVGDLRAAKALGPGRSRNRAVTRAVRNGTVVDDPRLAAVARDHARFEQRRLGRDISARQPGLVKAVGLAFGALGLVLLLIGAVLQGGLLAAAGPAVALSGPHFTLRQLQRAHRSEVANATLLGLPSHIHA
jgi:hypothetical protein